MMWDLELDNVFEVLGGRPDGNNNNNNNNDNK